MARTLERCSECGQEYLPQASLGNLCPRCLIGLGMEAADAEERIGPYRLLDKLGEGGMGVVYLAEQVEPIRRRVALKLIKLGMDTSQVIARFESERQALALMDHPNVAKVFDAGATAQGRPYFVMEYVRGEPITAYCDRHRLDLHRRIELLVQACEAIQHAHRKGVIHRDVKPGNVLVAEADGRPRVQVIDFGVAKATAGPLTDRTLATRHGVMIGTPAYMSPEQAELGGAGVDTRTDVYSLGVLLYELMTGVPPFDPGELAAAADVAGVRKLLEDDPPRPSTRVRALGERAGESARARRTDAPALARELRGDLDWIVMKGLEKDPDRRYPSPAELVADLGRHLGDEPVLARPPSVGYRLGKLLRRHFFGAAARRRPLPAVTFVVLSAVIAGLLVWGGLGRWRSTRQAELAQRLGGEVRDFEWLIRVSQMSPLHPVEGDRQKVRERMDAVARMMEEIGDLARGPANYALGRGHLALGDATAAAKCFERAWSAGYRDAETAAGFGLALGEIYRVELAKARQIGSSSAYEERIREIEARYRDRALELLRRRGSESFLPEEYVEALLAFYQGRYDEAADAAETAVASSPWLFEALVLQGDAYFESAVARWEAGDADGAGALAANADRSYGRAAEIAASSAEAHLGRCAISGLLLHLGLHDFEWDLESAWEAGEQACHAALTVDPCNAEVHHQFSIVLVSWGVVTRRRGDDPSALYERASRHILEALELAGGRAEFEIELADIYRMRAAHMEGMGSDPRSLLSESEAAFRRALRQEPRNSMAWSNMALVFRDRASYEIERGLDARESLERSVAAIVESLRIEPQRALPLINLGTLIPVWAEEQERRGMDPCAGLVEILDFLEALTRQDGIPQQAEVESRLRALLSGC